jgi:hypothetical protein
VQLTNRNSLTIWTLAATAVAVLAADSALAQSPTRRTRTQSGAMIRQRTGRESEASEEGAAVSMPRSMRSSAAVVEVEGTLKRNTGARRDESPYWLMEKGVAKFAVSPGAGVDLEEYEGQRIVIQGRKQKMPGEMTPKLIVAAAERKASRIARQRDEANEETEMYDEEVELASMEEEAPTLAEEVSFSERPVGSAAKRRMVSHEAEEEFAEAEERPVMRNARASKRMVRGSAAAMMQDNAVYEDGGPEYYGDGPYMDDGQGGFNFGCNSCGDFCNGCLPGDYGHGLQGGLYLRAEYLHWWTKGMTTPPLVTTSTDTALNTVNGQRTGAIDAPNTTILFPSDRLFDTSRSGARIMVGMWIDPCHQHAIEGEYFSLAQSTTRYTNSANGRPGSQVIMRPFTQVGGLNGAGNAPAETGNSAEIVSFPNIASGSIDVVATNRFQGAGLWINRIMSCGADCDRQYQFGFNYGWRYLRLDDDISITENVTNLQNDANNTGTDSFQTKNVFNGFVFGPNFATRWNCWSLQGNMRLALGGTRTTSRISGTLNSDGAVFTDRGILLVQTSNFGTRERSDFAVVPELNLLLGYQINPCWRATIGTSFIYWPKVYRAGDLINTDVNTDFLDNTANTINGLRRPDFRWVCDDFWAYGVSVGLEARW